MFPFKPVNNLASDSETFIVMSQVFTNTELEAIIKAGDNCLGFDERAKVGTKRDSELGWIKADHQWLYERLAEVARQINANYFHYDLFGFVEPLQYTVYKEGGHFAWHQDKHNRTEAPRKLSMSVQLSDDSWYDGGDLEIMTSNLTNKMPRKIGDIIIFPSWTLHRVTPVTRGIRRSLVAWCAGPNFK